MAATEEPAPDDLGIGYLRDATFVGRGGFAHVYAATDTRFDRRVAVKVFDHLLTDDDRALFEAECRTTGRLDRVPNIITVHDVEYTADGRPCIVMTYLEGGSLADHLRRQGLIPWRRATGYMVTVLEALEAAHRHGVLHRDIKPENILLEDGQAYLTDFGLATLTVAAAAGTDVGTAQVIASPLHASPETFAGIRDERSDVYSAASTLYNLIAGHAPFQGDPDLSTEAIIRRLRTQAPAHLPAGLAPRALDAALQRALAKDPANRQQTAGELAAELKALLDANPPPGGSGPSATAQPTSVVSPARAVATLPLPPASQAAPPPASQVVVAPPPTPGSSPSGGPTLAPPATGRRHITRGVGLRVATALVAVAAVLAGTLAVLRADDDAGADPVTPGPVEGVAAPSATVAPADPDVLPPGNEQLWAANRDQVVAEIKANGWRWDQQEQAVHLPSGLVVDLTTCPREWSAYQGLHSDEIRLGQITPAIVDQAMEDNAAGFDAYLTWVANHGGLPSAGGARFPYVDGARDGSLSPGYAELMADAFAVRRLTDGSVDEAADRQSAACVPDPLVPADGPGWTDPANRPWLWSDRLSPTSQGWLLGETLARSFPNRSSITVTVLAVGDDVGRAAEQGLRDHLDRRGPPVTLDVIEVDPTGDSSARAAVGRVASARPDAVLVLTGSERLCGDIAAELLASPVAGATPLLITAAACARATPRIEDEGTIAWLTLGDPRRTADQATTDGWTAWASAVLAEAGWPAPQSPAMIEGFASGWSMHQALLIADQLPGGISRPNLLLASRAMHTVNPSLVSGVGYGMAGGADGDLIEGAPVLRYRAADQAWGPSDVGVVDVAGRTLPCRWDRNQRACS